MKTQFILSIVATYAAWYVFAVSEWNVALCAAIVLSCYAGWCVFRFFENE